MIKSSVRYVLMALGLAAGAAFWSSSVAAEEPSEAEIRAAIAKRLEAGLSVQELRYQVFPTNEHAGRVSVAGTLVATDVRASAQQQAAKRIFLTDLGLQGISANAYEDFVASVRHSEVQFKLPNFFVIRVQEGAVVPFSGDVTYRSTVDGHALQAKVQYQVCCMARSDIERMANTIVVGSPRYAQFLTNAVKRIKQTSDTVSNMSTTVFGGFNRSASLVIGDKVVGHILPFDPSKLEWTQSSYPDEHSRPVPTFEAKHRISVTAPGNGGFKLAAGMGRPDWTFRPGQTGQLTLRLRVHSTNPSLENACVGIANYQQYACWDGTGFSEPFGRYGGIYDYEREAYMSLVIK